jgi:hypothetical protein
MPSRMRQRSRGVEGVSEGALEVGGDKQLEDIGERDMRRPKYRKIRQRYCVKDRTLTEAQ